MSPPRTSTPTKAVPASAADDHLELLDEHEREAVDDAPAKRRKGRRREPVWMSKLVPPWLRRRAWLLAIAVIVGSVGGLMYGSSTKPSYTAVATLAVPPGATAGSNAPPTDTATTAVSTTTVPPGPGNAQGAQETAAFYAAIIRSDNNLLNDTAEQLQVPLSTLTSRVSVSVENGAAVLLLGYDAPNKNEAIRGVNALANGIVKSESQANSQITPKTLNLVQLADSASKSGLFAKYGIAIGFIFGLLVGAILVLVAERIDPRADKSADLWPVFNGSVAALPSELSLPEFGHAVLSGPSSRPGVTLAPLRWWDVPAAHHIEQTLSDEFPSSQIAVSTGLEDGMAHRLQDGSAVVLVVRSGERLRSVGDALGRLRLMGTSPNWIVLLDRDDLYD
jgi:hypothetical protein